MGDNLLAINDDIDTKTLEQETKSKQNDNADLYALLEILSDTHSSTKQNVDIEEDGRLNRELLSEIEQIVDLCLNLDANNKTIQCPSTGNGNKSKPKKSQNKDKQNNKKYKNNGNNDGNGGNGNSQNGDIGDNGGNGNNGDGDNDGNGDDDSDDDG